MDHWERLWLRSWIVEEGEERLYQEGLLGQMLPPEELLSNRFDGSLPLDMGSFRRDPIDHQKGDTSFFIQD